MAMKYISKEENTTFVKSSKGKLSNNTVSQPFYVTPLLYRGLQNTNWNQILIILT